MTLASRASGAEVQERERERACTRGAAGEPSKQKYWALPPPDPIPVYEFGYSHT
jgi:hypothetical protein